MWSSRRSSAPTRTARSSPASSSAPWCTSLSAPTRPSCRGRTIATTISTSSGTRSRATRRPSRHIWTIGCTVSTTAPPTPGRWARAAASCRPTGRCARRSTTGSDGRLHDLRADGVAGREGAEERRRRLRRHRRAVARRQSGPPDARARSVHDLRVGRRRLRPEASADLHRRPVLGHRLPGRRADARRVQSLPAARPDRRRLPGGAQVDRFGNINSTVIGDYGKPKVRLPGSGGACEIAALAKKVVITIANSKRTLPERVDFVTSPGYLRGGRERESLGLSGGPELVITDMGVYRFDPKTREMVLVSVHPGVTPRTIKENIGWDVKEIGRAHV